MKQPKMILFDYGQTLVSETLFDGVKGSQAVLNHVRCNPQQVDGAGLHALADQLNREIGQDHLGSRYLMTTEIPNQSFQRYLYEYFQLELELPPLELETLFWDAAAPGQPTEGAGQMLKALHRLGIRTGVISNLSFSGRALEERLGRLLPDNHFEFVLASSDYVFRKPHPRLFALACRKAALPAGDIWYCGNDVRCDIEGAAACGLYPVWYTGALFAPQEPPACAHLTIGRWEELTHHLERKQENSSCAF